MPSNPIKNHHFFRGSEPSKSGRFRGAVFVSRGDVMWKEDVAEGTALIKQNDLQVPW